MANYLPALGGTLLLGATLLAAPAARAQPSPELTMEIYNSNIQAITSGIINKSMLDNAVARNNSRAARGTATGRITYVPTAALRQQTVQAYANRLKASNPTGAQAIATTFGPGKYDYGQVYHGIMKASGLRENDAADVLASYLVVGWMIVNNVQDGNAITVPMARGVRVQVAPLLAGNAQARSRAGRRGTEAANRGGAGRLAVGYQRRQTSRLSAGYRPFVQNAVRHGPKQV